MIDPDQEQIEEYTQKFDDSAEEKFKAIQWQAMEELLYQGRTYAEACQIVSILHGDNIVAVMLKSLCMAQNTAYLPTSDEMESLGDHFDEVRQKYAEHCAKQDINEEIEASCSDCPELFPGIRDQLSGLKV